MNNNFNIPDSQLPALRMLCEKRVAAINDIVAPYQKELEDLLVLLVQIEDAENKGIKLPYHKERELPMTDASSVQYNSKWTVITKCKYVLSQTPNITVKQITEEIIKLDKRPKEDVANFVKTVSAIISQQVKKGLDFNITKNDKDINLVSNK
jgi:hypothetical protein